MKRKLNKNQPKGAVILDYHQRPFLQLTLELIKSGYDFKSQAHTARDFWILLPYGPLDPVVAYDYVMLYARRVESEMAAILCRKSVAYWLHLFRRIGPGKTGRDHQDQTILITRSILEATAQKYGQIAPCPNLAPVNEVGIKAILSGLLMDDRYVAERISLEHGEQIALTVFSPENLREFYDLEKLAYEIWRCGAMLRGAGKGSIIAVAPNPPYVGEARDDDLDFLIHNFDQRDQGPFASGKGIIVSNDKDEGRVLVPRWNAGEVNLSSASKHFEETFRIKLGPNYRPNFMWAPFPFREFVLAHRAYADEFAAHYGISYETYFLVLGVLLARIPVYWMRKEGSVIRSFQRAYEGLYTTSQLISEIQFFAADLSNTLGLQIGSKPSEVEILSVLSSISLDNNFQKQMTILSSRKHAILLPAFSERWFVDLAWIVDHLLTIFDGLRIKDERFKGGLLEDFFKASPSRLPSSPCRATDGTEKQIDYAISVPPYLVILECKAASRFRGVETGSPTALKLRREKVVDLALRQVDDKARWLAEHPKGRNYDISEYTAIVPIGVSPFCEYTHSRDLFYWLTENVPRVLSPTEVNSFLASDGLPKSLNRVQIIRPHQI